jgi:outer membrane lipoprotein-sorting protein
MNAIRLGHTFGLCTLLALPNLSFAETPEEKGLAIANASHQRDAGWQDMQADMKMILRNAQGEESVREIRSKALEVEGDGDKSLTLFDTPLDVKGTAFLSYAHPVDADDQWLYLPALKRVKRISSRSKSGPFMGSEFSFEDMSGFEVEKYTYRHLKDEPCDLGTCHVVEQYPVDPYSGYTKRTVWLDTQEYRLTKVVFYDRKDALLKTLTYQGYQEYINYYWRPDVMVMTNHQTGKSTELKWSNIQFKTGLTDRDFDQAALKRAR